MKICYFSDGIHFFDQKFLSALVDKGYDVHMVSFASQKLPEALRQMQLHIYHRRLSYFSHIYPNLLCLLLFKRIVRRINPDIIHSGWIQTYGFYTTSAYNYPVLSMPWGSDILTFPKKSPLLKKITKKALLRADMITCDCQHVKKEILKLVAFPEERIVVFPWGVDLKMFNPSVRNDEIRRKLRWEDKLVVIHDRNFYEIYGIEYVIDAIPNILRRIPDARFLFCGTGPLKQKMEQKISVLGLSDYVYFAGYIENWKLPSYLASSDVYVSSSLSDGTSVALLEAMACGLPVVVTDIPANIEWVQNGENGFVVPSRNSEILACRIVGLLRDKALREKFSKRNLVIARERADWNKSLDILADIYRRLSDRIFD